MRRLLPPFYDSKAEDQRADRPCPVSQAAAQKVGEPGFQHRFVQVHEALSHYGSLSPLSTVNLI